MDRRIILEVSLFSLIQKIGKRIPYFIFFYLYLILFFPSFWNNVPGVESLESKAMVREVERWVCWLNPVITGEWDLGWSEDEGQAQGPRQDVDFFRFKWFLSGRKTTGHPNSFVLLKMGRGSESCWSNQNQEMEIETLRIQIILSTKPRKQTFK